MTNLGELKRANMRSIPFLFFLTILILGCRQPPVPEPQSNWRYETHVDPITDAVTKLAVIEKDEVVFGIYQKENESFILSPFKDVGELIARFDKNDPVILQLSNDQFLDEPFVLNGLQISSSLALRDTESGKTIMLDVHGFDSDFFDESRFSDTTEAYLAQVEKQKMENLKKLEQLKSELGEIERLLNAQLDAKREQERKHQEFLEELRQIDGSDDQLNKEQQNQKQKEIAAKLAELEKQRKQAEAEMKSRKGTEPAPGVIKDLKDIDQ